MRLQIRQRSRPAIRPPSWRGSAVRTGLFCFIVLCAHVRAIAAPSLLWSPDAATRSAVELLADDAGLQLPVMQWPLPLASVSRALDALPADLPPGLDLARAQVRDALRRQVAAAGGLTVRSRADAIAGYGDDATPGSSVRVRSSALTSSQVTFQVGGRLENDDTGVGSRRLRLDDSLLATEAFGVQVQAWSHRSWWGPGWQSSLALSSNAPAFNGFGFQRVSAMPSASPWLAWLGPWNVDVFLAQTEDVTQPANPYLFGSRLSVRPFSNLEIGVTRMAQWGGRGHEQNAKSFLKMLTGSGTNADTAGEQKNDPANQLAGFDLRWRCPFGVRCAAYTQLMGEDQAGVLPSRYLGLYGLESWSADGAQRVYAEYAETACATPIGRSGIPGCAYRNYAFPQGYASAGRWIGASVGPDSRMLTLGWMQTAWGSSLRLNAGRVGSRIGAYSPNQRDPEQSGRSIGISGRQSVAVGNVLVTPEASWQQIHAADGTRVEARIGIDLQMALDDDARRPFSGLGDALAGRQGDWWTPALVGAGLVGGALLLDHGVDAYAVRHGDKPADRAVHAVGDAVPLVGAGVVGAAWLLQRGTTDGDLAFSALAAGVTAYVASDAVKYAVDRARPGDERGNASFGGGSRGGSSFPSSHSAVAWALVTPYAQHDDNPWLYGLAALTNAGRVLGRDHWLSDTVAGAALGYVTGTWFYRRSTAADAPRLSLTPRSVRLDMAF